MNSGADVLGKFYEVFLKYANWAKELGIVLTPRHITSFAVNVMNINQHDIIFDPTCGTGGFLVAALDYAKKTTNEEQIGKFKRNKVFGIEQDSGVASLAVVNMIFRGDGKNNIIEGNCFAKFLDPAILDGVRTARYTTVQSNNPPITKVLMNPPFALKRSDEKEYKFINQALKQMEEVGILFSIFPYSGMVKPGNYKRWRGDLLNKNTLLSVITFPEDLFYPIGVHTVGVFIKRGIPHPKTQNVLWIRALSDGLIKSKGKRLTSSVVTNDLEKAKDVLKAFLANPSFRVENIKQFQKACPIDYQDPQLELVPEVYLEQAPPTGKTLKKEVEKIIRDAVAFLIKSDIDGAYISDLSKSSYNLLSYRNETNQNIIEDVNWAIYVVTDLFELQRGDFHSLSKLDEGNIPTVSRVSDNNGVVGYYDPPENARIYQPGVITVSTVTGDAFLQLKKFIATDNVVICIPKEPLRITTLFFIQAMINQAKWRYSYGRQCYKTKFAQTKIYLPVNEPNILDEDFMEETISNTSYWSFLKEYLEC